MKNISLFIVLSLLAFACVNTTKETPNGLKFNIVFPGDGILPRPGDVTVFDFKLIDSKDSVWGETYNAGLPAAVMIQDSSAIPSEDGMMQMLRMVSKGDSVLIDFTMKDFFQTVAKSPIPPGVDSTRSLAYRIKVHNIMSRDSFMTYQQNLMESQKKEQFEKDVNTIDAYLTGKGITAAQTESGIRFVITVPGKGENAKSGQSVKVHYSGYLLDGRYFDSSVKEVAEANGLFNPSNPYEPYSVTIDQSSVIQGWHDALKVMNKGSKATFYIPSTLAYGPQQRSEVIKPNSILVFDLEVVEITETAVR